MRAPANTNYNEVSKARRTFREAGPRKPRNSTFFDFALMQSGNSENGEVARGLDGVIALCVDDACRRTFGDCVADRAGVAN
jgi:hypothetical protein